MLIANGALLVLNLATGIMLARSLGPAGRGELVALTVWPQTLAYMLTLGVPNALVYYSRKSPDDRSDLFRAAAILGVCQGLLATLVGIAFVLPVGLHHFGPEILRLAQLLMLASPAALLGLITAAGLQARTRFGSFNILQLSQPVLSLVGFTLLALDRRLSAESASWVVILSVLPGLAYFALGLIREPPSRKRDSSNIRQLLSYGIRSYPLDLLGTLGLFVDQALVTALLGPLALGLYVVALRASRVLSIFQQAVIPVLFARTSGAKTPEVVASTGRAARLVLAAALCCAIFVAVLGEPLLRLAYGRGFVAAAPALRLLAAEAVLSTTAWILAQAFLALGRPGTVSALIGIGFTCMIVLLVLLVPRFGFVGAAAALLIGAAIRLALIELAFPVVLRCRPPRPILTRDDLTWVASQLRARGRAAEAVA
jgi:O-antigen/teichoic acid export membrane protein